MKNPQRRKTPRYTDRLKALQLSVDALLAESRFLRERITAMDTREEAKELRRILKERYHDLDALTIEDSDDPSIH